MRSGVIWVIVGLIIGFIGALFPFIGWPLIAVGGIIAIVGWIKIFWGAGKKAVGATTAGAKAASNATKAITGKGSGSGTL